MRKEVDKGGEDTTRRFQNLPLSGLRSNSRAAALKAVDHLDRDAGGAVNSTASLLAGSNQATRLA